MIAALAGSAAAVTVLLVWAALVRRVAARRPARGATAAPRPGRVRLAHAPGLPWTSPPTAVDPAPLLDELARRVRAGGSLADALAVVTAESGWSASAPLQAAARRHRRGLAVAEAYRPMADDTDPAIALVGATVCAVARFGGRSGLALDTAAAALRERHAVRAEVRAQAATARLSALVLVVLPVGFGSWTLLTDPDARAFMLGTPTGWAVTGAGLALDGAGAWWMRRLVAAAERA